MVNTICLTKIVRILIIPFVAIIIGCDGGGSTGTAPETNRCFSLTAANPCYDPNTGGSARTSGKVIARDVEEELKAVQGFVGELEIINILYDEFDALDQSSPDNGCLNAFPLRVELIIRNNEDWDRFRQSCFFSMYSLPDINFEQRMVIISTQNNIQESPGARVFSALDFGDKLEVVIDYAPREIVPPPFTAFTFNIVSVSKRDVPVNFIQVFNRCIQTAEMTSGRELTCFTEALRNNCDDWLCSFGPDNELANFFGFFNGCEVSGCDALTCDGAILENLSMITGEFMEEELVFINRVSGTTNEGEAFQCETDTLGPSFSPIVPDCITDYLAERQTLCDCVSTNAEYRISLTGSSLSGNSGSIEKLEMFFSMTNFFTWEQESCSSISFIGDQEGQSTTNIEGTFEGMTIKGEGLMNMLINIDGEESAAVDCTCSDFMVVF